MRARTIVALACASALVALAECSLDESGTAVDGADALIIDGGDASCVPCADLITSGWELVAYASGNVTCPNGYAQEGVTANPVPSASTCSCACDSPAGLCENGTISQSFNGSSCSTAASPFIVDGKCVPFGSQVGLSDYNQIYFKPSSPPPCTPRQLDAGSVGQPGTLCRGGTSCDGRLCSGTPLLGFASCIATQGDVSCPDGGFQQRSLVANSVTIVCSPCSCGSVAVACTGALSYYTDKACATDALDVENEAGCQASAEAGALTQSYRWNGVVLDAGCQPSGSDASVIMTNERTVCCR